MTALVAEVAYLNHYVCLFHLNSVLEILSTGYVDRWNLSFISRMCFVSKFLFIGFWNL